MSADGPIFPKYHVSRADAAEFDINSKHYGGCRYFVLDIDHDPYARPAIAAYAAHCVDTHPQLAQSLWDLIQDDNDHG